MTGATIGLLAACAGIAAVGAGTHVALYGPRRAPANRAHLSRLQWLSVAGLAAIPVGAIIALLASAGFRAFLAARFGPDGPGRVVAFCFLALMAIVWGMMPALREAEPEGSARAV